MKMNFILPVGFLVSVMARTVGITTRAIKPNRTIPAIIKPLVDVYQDDLIFQQ